MVEVTQISIPETIYVEWAGFLKETPVFALADGRVIRAVSNLETITAHEGLLLAKFHADKAALISGGEDGKVVRTNYIGDSETIGSLGNRWINSLAISQTGAVAASSGKQVSVFTTDGKTINIELERSAEGLAFAPKGLRLAIARFNGVELRWVNSPQANQFLEWAGAHVDVCFSPDGKTVVSTMQENALHGWRLSDQRHMQMTGYTTKVKSTSWSKKGKWLATSGAPAAIVWPFRGKDGPMGKAPLELGIMGQTLVTHVCCHHQEDVIAVGYENGMIMVVKIDGGDIVSLRGGGDGEITSLNWHQSGTKLAYGSSEGEAGIIDISS